MIQETRLKICRQCKMVYYCSRTCQKLDWKHRHRNECYYMYSKLKLIKKRQ